MFYVQITIAFVFQKDNITLCFILFASSRLMMAPSSLLAVTALIHVEIPLARSLAGSLFLVVLFSNIIFHLMEWGYEPSCPTQNLFVSLTAT